MDRAYFERRRLMSMAYLHIGAPKTGTTSIQVMLANSRLKLREQGVFVAQSLGVSNQFALEVYATDFDRPHRGRAVLSATTLEDFIAFSKKVEDDLAREVEEAGPPCEVAIFSNEGLSGMREPREIERVRRLFGRHWDDLKVLFYIRRQDLNAVSQYTTLLKTGETRKNIFINYGPRSQPYFFYHRIAELWSSVVGPENIQVRLFDRRDFHNGDLIEDFLNCCGLPGVTVVPPQDAENPALDPAACEFLRLYNEQCAADPSPRNSKRRQMIVQLLEQNRRGKGLRPSRTQAQAFLEKFRQSNESLREMFFPDRAQLFDEDFSMYGETPDAAVLTEADIAAVSRKVIDILLEDLAARPEK